MKYFLCYRRCKKNQYNFFQLFKIPLNNFDDCERLYSCCCPLCKMVTFLDFKKAANEECVHYLKERQFVAKLRQQIKD